MILRERVDVCIMLDAGVRADDVTAKTRNIKASLGPGYGVFIFPTVYIHYGTSVGGAIVIVHNRLKSRQINQLAPLGTLIEVKGVLGNQPIAVYGIYSAVTQTNIHQSTLPRTLNSPQPTQGRNNWVRHPHHTQTHRTLPPGERIGSLHSKVHALLSPDDGTVHEHLRGVLLDGLALSAVEGRTYFVGGDFNYDMTAGRDIHKFGEVIDGLHMQNSESLSQQTRSTYKSAKNVTRIDHMFHSPGAKPEGCRLVRNVHHHNGHAGLLASYQVDRGPRVDGNLCYARSPKHKKTSVTQWL